MEFTHDFLKKMKKSTLRQELGYKLQVSYFTICAWLEQPEKDELTKVKYLELLCEVSGMSKEEIFITND
jgi:hypothetical protein